MNSRVHEHEKLETITKYVYTVEEKLEIEAKFPLGKQEGRRTKPVSKIQKIPEHCDEIVNEDITWTPRDDAIHEIVTAKNSAMLNRKSMKSNVGKPVYKITTYAKCVIEDEIMEENYENYMVRVEKGILAERLNDTPNGNERVKYESFYNELLQVQVEEDFVDHPRDELYMCKQEANYALLEMLKKLNNDELAKSIVNMEEIERLSNLKSDTTNLSLENSANENTREGCTSTISELELRRQENIQSNAARMKQLFDSKEILEDKPKEEQILEKIPVTKKQKTIGESGVDNQSRRSSKRVKNSKACY